jgi:Do/DeqQ family serine protease
MKWKQLVLVVAVSASSALSSVWMYGKLAHKNTAGFVQSSETKLPVNYAGFFDGTPSNIGEPVDFSKAANTAVPAVVHIKTKIPAKKVSNQLPRNRNGIDDWFDQFFNYGPQVQPEQRASGSGVIISEDGYIVTNNHVVSDGNDGIAEEITVTMHNKKVYKARVIGRDPSSDLAVLKIDGNGFPFLLYGNSDNVKLGQWVLAVGYPLTLETTVTAGIVSAKGRSIGINSRQSTTPIESFIQTDAAVNQGNSGGALVSTDGQLVGINSAILAPSGTYAGYSFAIPVNIVKKIVNDLIQFGNVKRGYLGVSYIPAEEENEKMVKQTGLTDGQGVYVLKATDQGAALKAGLKKGDVITKVNGTPVSSGLEMSGQIASLKPGDEVPITYVRANKEYTATVVLKETSGNIDNVVSSNISDILGGDLETLSAAKADSYGLEGGVVVKKIRSNGLLSKTRMQDGFIITSVSGRQIKNIEELGKILSSAYGTVKLEGIYPGSDTYVYPLTLGDD